MLPAEQRAVYALLRNLPGQTEFSGSALAGRVAAFPVSCRMRARAQFERALHAKCLVNKWFFVHLHNNECGFSRLGIIASKRIMPKAVARNLAKRLIRESFRLHFSRARSVDVLVRVRRQVTEKSAGEGRAALLQLLQTVPA